MDVAQLVLTSIAILVPLLFGGWILRLYGEREKNWESRRALLEERLKLKDEELQNERHHIKQMAELNQGSEKLLQGQLEELQRKAGVDPEAPLSASAPAIPEEVQQNMLEILGQLQDIRTVVEQSAPAGAAPTLTADDHVFRGNAYFQAGQFREALAAYQQALSVRPNDVNTVFNSGLALRNLGDKQEELAAFTFALRLQPNDLGILVEHGVALHRLGRHAEALTDYNRVLAIRPNDPAALYNRAGIYALRGDGERALGELRQALAGDPRYRHLASQDEDFASIRDDLRFRDLFPVVSVTSAECGLLDAVSVEVRAKDTLVGIGAWSIDVMYDITLVNAVGCAGHSGSICNPSFTASSVRITGASAEGHRSEVLLGTIDFQAGRTPGVAMLAIAASVLADATVGAPRDTRAGLIAQAGAITIQQKTPVARTCSPPPSNP